MNSKIAVCPSDRFVSATKEAIYTLHSRCYLSITNASTDVHILDDRL